MLVTDRALQFVAHFDDKQLVLRQVFEHVHHERVVGGDIVVRGGVRRRQSVRAKVVVREQRKVVATGRAVGVVARVIRFEKAIGADDAPKLRRVELFAPHFNEKRHFCLKLAKILRGAVTLYQEKITPFDWFKKPPGINIFLKIT